MKKINYTIPEENGTMAAEPAAVAIVPASSRIATDRLSIPVGMPQSVDEALRDLEEGEKEFERNETFSHREVMQMVWDKIGSYAD